MKGTEMNVTYFVRVRFHATQQEGTLHFDSMMARALAIISLSSWADVLQQWQE